MSKANRIVEIGLAVLRKNCINVSSQAIVVGLGPFFLDNLFSQVLTESEREFGV